MPEDFSQLGIRPELVEQLRRVGVKEPTPIQAQAIPHLMEGRDVIAQAQTGTGKTLAFLLPILQRVDVTSPHLQALILTPTRELAIQITAEAKKLAPTVGASILAAYGGQDVESQIRKLKGGAQLIVATPGRLLDHMRRGTIRLDKLAMLVLDEADQMLHMGFLPDVEQVIGNAGRERSTMLFSATMPPQIRTLAKRYMHAPAEVYVQGKTITLEEIEQVVVETTDRTKLDDLCAKIDEYNPYLAVIFCRTRAGADTLYDSLTYRGYNADVLHGDLSQAKREQVMRKFREARIQYLVATDVAARGIDVEGVSHVFNYDIPHDVESYIHRIGRTGRAGQTGVAVTFVTGRDQEYLRMIEHGVKGTLERLQARGGGVLRSTVRERPVREARPEGVSRREHARASAKRAGAAGGVVGKGRAGGGRAAGGPAAGGRAAGGRAEGRPAGAAAGRSPRGGDRRGGGRP